MINRIKKSISFAFGILRNPENEFKELKKKSIDSVLSDYIVLLLSAGVLGGFANLLFMLIRTFYYDFILNANINYFGILNYSLGISMSILFFFIFAGTALMFILSYIVNIFLKGKFVDSVKLIMYSAVPLMMFGWIPLIGYGNVVWSFYLLYNGYSELKD